MELRISTYRTTFECYYMQYYFRFIGPFIESVQKIESNILLTTKIIDKWITTQSKLIFLQEIFIDDYFCTEIPEETRIFYTVDQAYTAVIPFYLINYY